MPTGYTADVASGKITKFSDFAMRCARAFGACITLRDEPVSTDIPEFTASDYNKTELDKQTARLEQLLKITSEEAQIEADAEYLKACKYYNERVAEDAATKNRYEKMLARVSAWKPPTPEHVGMKNFMVQQLVESIRFDAYAPEKPVAKTGAVWLGKQIADCRDNIEHHTKANAEEISRVASRNKWVKDLRESLKS